MDASRVIAETRAWLERVVIGLNLCPFARAVHAKGQIRWVVSDAVDASALLDALGRELRALAAADPQRIDTTLLIHPQVLGDFADYNDFLALADGEVQALGHEGVLQVASFHPHYCFADAAPDDVTNATNRSPYPMLHLLREASVERAVAAFADAQAIYGRNLETMRALGADGWAELQAQCRRDARGADGAAPQWTAPR